MVGENGRSTAANLRLAGSPGLQNPRAADAQSRSVHQTPAQFRRQHERRPQHQVRPGVDRQLRARHEGDESG